jgi:hypothetical protein
MTGHRSLRLRRETERRCARATVGLARQMDSMAVAVAYLFGVIGLLYLTT